MNWPLVFPFAPGDRLVAEARALLGRARAEAEVLDRTDTELQLHIRLPAQRFLGFRLPAAEGTTRLGFEPEEARGFVEGDFGRGLRRMPLILHAEPERARLRATPAEGDRRRFGLTITKVGPARVELSHLSGLPVPGLVINITPAASR